MLSLRTILVATDYSECADRAFPPAAELAARTGAALRAVHVAGPREAGPPPPIGWDDVAPDLPAAPGVLGAAEAPAGAPLGAAPAGMPVDVVRGDVPAEAVLRHARALDADLVVMGTHGRRGFRRYLLGSVASEVVRRADRPVLVVPCGSSAMGSRVVAPVDFSEPSREALALAKTLAAERGASLDVLHAVEVSTARLPYAPASHGEAEAALLARAEAELRRFVETTPGPDVETRLVVRPGVPPFVIAEAAAEPAALVVMATHGWTAVGRFTGGSVTDRVLRMAPCPVLVVHPGARPLGAARAPRATAVPA